MTRAPSTWPGILEEWARDGLVNIVGGCCGTTPDHIRAIAQAVSKYPPRKVPELQHKMRLSGLEPFEHGADDAMRTATARRTSSWSASGPTSPARPNFRKLIEANDYAAALEVAREQVESGAQMLDVNMDEGMLDSEKAMTTFLNLIAAEPDISRVPIMIDSSKWSVIEAGLKCVQGKSVVNSISLKEGEGPFLDQAKQGAPLRRRRRGDGLRRAGPGRDAERKFEICKRAYELLTENVGFAPEDIIFDPNVFAVATGIEEHNDYATPSSRRRGASRKSCPTCMSRAASPTSPLPSAATISCARRCTRCSSTTPSAPASTWPSSMPASCRSMTTSRRSSASWSRT